MNPTDAQPVLSLFAAAGIGMLVGIERERSNGADGGHAVAGLRTFTLAALLGAVAQWLGPAALVLAGAGVVLLTAVGYRRSSRTDPGLTSEIALLLTCLLGAYAQREPAIAAGVAVVVTGLLATKDLLHRFTRELLSEREVLDGLLLLASAVVVLPLLPERAVDPWGVLKPSAVWRLVVLVMAVGVLGHIAIRAVGARWGLPVAGFFSGFVSSTAAVAGFGQRARQHAALRTPCVAAAMLANLGSLLLMVAVVGAASPALLQLAWAPLLAAGAVLLGGGLLGLWHAPSDAALLPQEPQARAFRLGHALLFAAIIAAVLLLSAALKAWVGPQGALAVAVVAALAEWHAAAATVAQLAGSGAVPMEQARIALVVLLAASTLAKSAIAFGSGGRAYGLRVSAGLVATCLAAAAALWRP